jgi:hypothetical protein
MRSSSDWLRSMSVLAAGSGGKGLVPNSFQYSITLQLRMSNFLPNTFMHEPMPVCDSIFSASRNTQNDKTAHFNLSILAAETGGQGVVPNSIQCGGSWAAKQKKANQCYS